MAGGEPIRISHFRVEKELRRDVLGYFFHAIDELLDRPVALRVVRASQIERDGTVGPIRARIRSNAKIAAAIGHPNLVTIYEFRSLPETDLVVMEWVEGQTLEDARRSGRRWTVVDVARMLARLADALAAAHAAGLVHGNVSARNVRVRADGRLKLLDLGIPKLDMVDDRVPYDPSDDVRGLARMACALLGPPVQHVPEGKTFRDPLDDPARARAQFGFLSQALTKALKDETGFETAAAFREAVLQAIEQASGRSTPRATADGSLSTRLVGPDLGSAAEDELPVDGSTLEALSPAALPGRPRLVLPPDLAKRATLQDLAEPGPLPDVAAPANRLVAWLRAVRQWLPRRTGVVLAVAAVLLVSVAFSAWAILQRAGVPEPTAPGVGVPSDSTSPVLQDEGTGDPAGGTGTTPADGMGDTLGVTAAGSITEPIFAATVRASPAGATIAVIGDGGGRWTDDTELAVAPGDSLLVEISKPGYVTQRHVFRGSRLSVALQPDSVIARFRSNIAADVYLLEGGSERRLGTTAIDVRLPTGTHRIVFRSPGQPDWEEEFDMPQAGGLHDIVKTDYVTTGGFVATVAGSWARVSVDGGPARETPARFDDLAVGFHVVTVSRAGFSTLVDTVLVSAGQVLARQYTLRR